MEDTTSQSVKLPKLQGITNIEQWSDIITSAFMTYDIDMVIFEPKTKPTMKNPEAPTKEERESKESWRLKSNKARGLIIISLVHRIITELGGSEHLRTIEPHELWQNIQSRYHKKNWAQKWATVAKIEALQLKNGDDIRLYTAEVRSILHELKRYDITVENALALIVLIRLPFELDLYASHMSQKSHDQATMPALEDLLSNIEQEHDRIALNKKSSVNALRRKSGKSSTLRSGRTSPPALAYTGRKISLM